MKTETIRKNIEEVSEGSQLQYEDMKAIFEYCKAEGMSDSTFNTASNALFDAIHAAFAIGFNRGRNYQKRLNKKSLIHAENTDQRQR